MKTSTLAVLGFGALLMYRQSASAAAALSTSRVNVPTALLSGLRSMADAPAPLLSPVPSIPPIESRDSLTRGYMNQGYLGGMWFTGAD